MRAKRTIACWLLVVYLLTAIAPAYASLTCRCPVAKARTEAACCHRHSPIALVGTPEQAEWNAPCCCNRHSTKIVLYTNGSDDRTDRIAAPVSAALLPDDLSVAAPALAFSERIDDRRAHFLCYGSVRCTGLRAPPTRH